MLSKEKKHMNDLPKKICFVSTHAILIFRNTIDEEPIGGSEFQQSLLAKELKCRGFEVSFIVKPDIIKKDEWIEGIKFIKAYNPNKGIKYIKNIFQIYKLYLAMKKANSDIYYFRGAKFESGVVALFCKFYKKKMIQAVANDMDCNLKTIKYINSNIKKNFYAYGLKNADVVLCQTDVQKKLLHDNFSLSSKLVKNMIPFSDAMLKRGLKKKSGHLKNVLWVGSIKPVKRPEFFINLAKKFHSIHFTMIGGKVNRYSSLYSNVLIADQKMSNFIHINFVPVKEIDDFFKQTDLLICTSTVEGFANTFLQAWANGKPVISSFDPDQVIQKFNIGAVANSEEQFASVLKAFSNDDSGELLKEMSQNAISYINKEHIPNVVIPKLTQVLMNT